MWDSILDLQVSVGEKVLRAVLIYVFLIIALRVVGKHKLGQASTLDLVVLPLVATPYHPAEAGGLRIGKRRRAH